MKLVFYVNYLNIHQVYVMDAFYHLLGEEFRFVATLPRNKKELKGGLDYSMRPYCILAAESENTKEEASRLAREAETCVFGACSQEYAVERAKVNPNGLSFEMGERWLKRGWINVFSSTLRGWYKNYYRFYRHRPYYKLSCSAFTAQDDERLFAYKDRHFKWGYFTSVEKYEEELHLKEDSSKITTIMWCARFLNWKHPELAIQLARKLKDDGYQIRVDMYGVGSELERMKQLSCSLGVTDIVHFKGSVPNDEIRKQMREHDIFLFTSDRNEGWGVVLNEAMCSRCAVVASDAIGAAPFLILDGVNGFLFKSEQIDSLYEKVVFLLNHPEERQQMAEHSYQDMLHIWSPRKAAESLLQLINDLQNGRETSLKEGPCSKA